MNEGCSVSLATDFFKAFLAEKMCAKCLPCMLGSIEILSLLEGIAGGRGRLKDIQSLNRLAGEIRETARCKLGKDAADFLTSSLEGHRDGYLSHIEDGVCPGSCCEKMTTYVIDPVLCNACGACKDVCQEGAIIGEALIPYLSDNRPMTILSKRCNGCGACIVTCIGGAIEIV